MWAVLVKKGSGIIAGLFSTLQGAQAYVGTSPGCGVAIVYLATDAQAGKMLTPDVVANLREV